MLFQTLKVIHTFLRKPPLPVPYQDLPKDLVHDQICLCDRATVRSTMHFYGAWNEGGDCANGCLQRFSYASKGFCSRRVRSEEHTSELQSHLNLVCRLLLEKKKTN